MISHISIKDFAIIEDVQIDFHEGLNLITGETAKCGDSLKPWDVLLLTEMIH